MHKCILPCMHAYIHTSMHTYIHTCMHACIHTYITLHYISFHYITYIRTYIHTYSVKFSPAPLTLGKALASKVELGLLPCEVAGMWELCDRVQGISGTKRDNVFWNIPRWWKLIGYVCFWFRLLIWSRYSWNFFEHLDWSWNSADETALHSP